MATWEVVFTDAGNVQTVWGGYSSYGEAYRAIVDADRCIPFAWDWVIQENTPEEVFDLLFCGAAPHEWFDI